jgi:hypothetical protein
MTGKDDSATTVANTHLKATTDAGYYKKCKIARSDILDVIHARDAARDYRRRMTSPWGDGDLRMLPTSRLLEYDTAMGEFKIKFEDSVMDLASNWNNIVDRQKKRLNKSGGSLFDPNDYPAQKGVTNWFVFKMEQLPIPEISHFALDLEVNILAKLKEDLQKVNDEKIAHCQMDMLARLIAPVANMADICSNDKRVFDSLVENMDQTVDILTDLNVMGNLQIMQLLKEAKDRLTNYTTGQIRKNKHLKQKLGQEAEALVENIRAVMGEI